MANSYILSGTDQLNLDATMWNQSLSNVTVTNAKQGQLSVHGTASSVLNVTGDEASSVSIDSGSSALSKITVNGLGASAFLVAGQGDVYSYGAASNNQFRVFATQGSHSYSSNIFNITAQNTLLVMNGSTYPSATNIYDQGGNQSWSGDGQTINYFINYQPTPSNTSSASSTLVAGGSTGTFNINGPQNTGATLTHLDIILDAITSSTNNYTVLTNNLPPSSAPINIFQTTGTLNFTGNNAVIVYNNSGNQTRANLTFTGNDQAYTGNQTSTIAVNGGDNSILVSGIGAVSVTGSNNATTNNGTLFIGSSTNSTGSINYTAGSENSLIATESTNALQATLGSGFANIYLKPLYNNRFDITIGNGNTILHDFTQSKGTNSTANNFQIHLASGQSIANIQTTSSGGTIYTLNTGNQVTFDGWQPSNGQNPFS